CGYLTRLSTTLVSAQYWCTFESGTWASARKKATVEERLDPAAERRRCFERRCCSTAAASIGSRPGNVS
ncbi:unnamed protein product, partial [Ectocarpus sp. 12 AP-2014]